MVGLSRAAMPSRPAQDVSLSGNASFVATAEQLASGVVFMVPDAGDKAVNFAAAEPFTVATMPAPASGAGSTYPQATLRLRDGARLGPASTSGRSSRSRAWLRPGC